MAGRLAIDFGTSNTAFALWNPDTQEAEVFSLPAYARAHLCQGERYEVVPSLIHYESALVQWIGNQVLERGLYESTTTFRWLKRYLMQRSPASISVENQPISYAEAARKFLQTLLLFAAEEKGIAPDEEIMLTVPVESMEYYTHWLEETVQGVWRGGFRIVDEPTAALLGYGEKLQPGDIYGIFDFGGGTLDVAIVRVQMPAEGELPTLTTLGKAGDTIGGSDIDKYLLEFCLQSYSGSDLLGLRSLFLAECERAKEKLSYELHTHLHIFIPTTGEVLIQDISRTQMEDILKKKGFYRRIHEVLDRAVADLGQKGYEPSQVQKWVMTGGASLIPSVQELLKERVGEEKVSVHRPFDAVVRGAASLLGGASLYDYIQHDYAIRHVNPQTRQYEYEVIVRRGTRYPYKSDTSYFIRATWPHQQRMGLNIFEVRQRSLHPHREVEIQYDEKGHLQLSSKPAPESSFYFWLNEKNPTFLQADPPAQEGEKVFEVRFGVDEKKRLTIDVRNLRQGGKWIYQGFPVVKLT
ncbi:MAG: Hsp70 family protein [Bacteroidia bacterium]|nr:Hsp70 family protein [Bacteroidia bacterium]